MKIIKVLGINLLLLVMLFEVVGFFSHDYLQQRIDLGFKSNGYKQTHFQKEIDIPKQAHPFFGYVQKRPNYFETAENFDAVQKDEKLRIGIFGGSVAEMLFDYWRSKGLKKRVHKKFANFFKVPVETIELIHFAGGGYKQPTQYNIASLYAQGLDLAINLEGYNEINYNFHEDFPLYYPLQSITNAYYSSPKALKNVTQVFQHYQNLKISLDWEKKITWSYSLNFLNGLKMLWHFNKINKNFKEMNSYTRPFHEDPKDRTAWKRTGFWLKMSCLQQNLLNSLQVPSFYFMQPAPHLEGSKPLSKVEVQLVADDPFTQAVTEDFNGAVKRLQTFQPSQFGLNWYDASLIFSQEPETMYIDGCCHLNGTGQRILTDFIIAAVKKQWQKAKKFPSCDILQLMEAVRAD